MKLQPKRVFLLLPLVLWALGIAFLKLQQYGLSGTFPNIDRVVWGKGEGQITVEITEVVLEDLEMHQYVITATNKEGKLLLRKSIMIDLDMGGTGMVTPMQADQDDNYEIIVATGRNVTGKYGYYLDYNGGEIKQRPLTDLDPQAIQSIRNQLALIAPAPFAVGYYLALTLVYYVLFFIAAWLIKKIRPRKSDQP
jgi:hypothetical protein